MHKTLLMLLLLISVLVFAAPDPLTPSISEILPKLETFYKDLHAHPELSLNEKRTARKIAGHLQKIKNIRVIERIGGYGVIGILTNGPGPTLMVRADMDALPLIEKTGASYASTSTITDTQSGGLKGVMHACGHDIHSTVLVGVAQILSNHRSLWNGTIALVAQPAEEIGKGAKAMISAKLFDYFPKPDAILALHVSAHHPVGHIAFIPGWATAYVDTLTITITGKGGHAALTKATISPMIAAAKLILQWETLTNQVLPDEPSALSVGMIQGGTQANVIPTSVTLKISMRTLTPTSRQKLLTKITELTQKIPAPLTAKLEITEDPTPAGYHDPQLTQITADLFASLYGKNNVSQAAPVLFGDDFSRYHMHTQAPALMFALGSVALHKLEKAKDPPPLHSPYYLPEIPSTIQNGIHAMSHLLIHLSKHPVINTK